MLGQKKIAIVQQEDDLFVDRGIGTMVDRVDETSLIEIRERFFRENTEDGLKRRADNLVSLALCSRGDNMRRLKSSIIGLIEFENEGVSSAKLFRCMWRK